MSNKIYYWAENLEEYSADNEEGYNQVIEIKRLNFFIGKNNAGKSRFLRGLFYSKNKPHSYQIDSFRKLLSISNKLKNNDKYKHLHSTQFYKDFFAQLDSLVISMSSYSPTNPDDQFYYCLDFLNRMNLLNMFEPNENISTLKNQFKNQYQQTSNLNFGTSKFYVPTLRGMRPVTEIENKQPYIDRAQKDYGDKHNAFNKDNTITGECLFHELKCLLLGNPEDRELVKNYEEKLSQYFFDNEIVTLIPKIEKNNDVKDKQNDVVHIKIGHAAQFPIYKLGDGLQQAIILTFEAFTKNQDIHSFFIEEPELHMHAGMVRQLMNFYLNETKHYYFFTTHSNHLLDMADESDQVIIQKFVKEQNIIDKSKFDFKIYRCDKDRDLLASLGVKPSSVYLANCTIWVEGITDRLYITKYMEKYLKELTDINDKSVDKIKEDLERYSELRRFMPNYHYTFIEYAGSNLAHWSFEESYPKTREERIKFLQQDRGQSATAVASDMLLIADGDIQKNPNKISLLKKELNKENLIILDCKETENTLPKDSIVRVAKAKFHRLKNVRQSYDISLIDNIINDDYFDNPKFGIGKLIDDKIKKPSSQTCKTAFADGNGVGTIKDKLKFCREVINDFDSNPDWRLTPKAKKLCETIFKHIEKCN
ncbi:hypothetical protein F959_02207 [Acinetobacter venetianus RAG-1 = CIP 110063]|uniref:Endonuclease GajA/Old nuclease/RecF-like AAA domain-containing protein n=1 Tax=Acinetobacter venetianus (strain ATCC 31012 / DSM 23050 / BCRC 14357 / CCUG 45561 / CIP 110063 / KCTC 2702 / LMG 19082 / RAG-1) TaxID=1191460 RepID=N8ZUE2_ACIVR|nr:AAA family ATPase [Acinetobacter venetianus]ENV37399.1 hypothetical protein F959_02207 [Acinetobacter venetianus RAG-1 = CIP 110063]